MRPELDKLRRSLLSLSAPALRNIVLELYPPPLRAAIRPHIIKMLRAELIDDVILPNIPESLIQERIASRVFA